MNERYYTTTEIAKQYEISARDLNRLLLNEQVITKRDGHYDLTTHNKKRGFEKMFVTSFMRSDGTPDESYSLKWTESGKQFIEMKIESLGFVKGV